VTVQNQRPTCPGELVESAPGVGECERGDECAVTHLRADYFTYRDAHARITRRVGRRWRNERRPLVTGGPPAARLYELHARCRRMRGEDLRRPRRWANARRELACLSALGGRLPVAVVVHRDLSIPRLTLGLLPGTHGQDLLTDGHAAGVLRLVGQTLVALQRIRPDTVPGLVGEGSVIVHGDFGPQNMLFDLEADRVTGVVDWESAHIGSPIEDLAWTEWIIRMHHPDAKDALEELFVAAGQRPSFSERHAAMVHQCEELVAFCVSAGTDSSSAEWRSRLRLTEAWTGE